MTRVRLLIVVIIFLAIGVNLALYLSGSFEDGSSNDLSQSLVDEPVLNWDSEVRVSPDDIVYVTEQIQVQGAGKKFKRGIIRPLPLAVKTTKGKVYGPSYEVSAVKRDGQTIDIPPPKNEPGFITYYLGDAEKFLAPGIYNYFFQYSANGLIDKQPNIKSMTLYVTGASVFPVYSSSVVVHLPDKLKEENVTFQGYIVEVPITSDVEPVRTEEGIIKKFELDDGSIDPARMGKPNIKISVSRHLKPFESFFVEISWAT